ncbi:uncharacterized protein STEHIDRAFT_112624 [Stereum hirsutum FP-91666 SS1]|uniref:uncharacterized protein n=1 Tax=Stereum hirsutum (strain FP-91666) TaxID=721885 RepID=UPI000444A81F|nr:uncharacterized protein STEHIDRAFT_112624 [Stereum hirsutum FP-91666 SS1]EIM85180.1 hypothetical protein STEHIDRAFT_112624 [Stereum hirsutum FP-91666 SS1]
MGSPLSPHTQTFSSSPSPLPYSPHSTKKIKKDKKEIPKHRARKIGKAKATPEVTFTPGDNSSAIEEAASTVQQPSILPGIFKALQDPAAVKALISILMEQNSSLDERLEKVRVTTIESVSCPLCYDVAVKPYWYGCFFRVLTRLFGNTIIIHALLDEDVPSDLKDLIQSQSPDGPLLDVLRTYFLKQRFPCSSCPLCWVEIHAVPIQVVVLTNTIINLMRGTTMNEEHSDICYILETGSFKDIFIY